MLNSYLEQADSGKPVHLWVQTMSGTAYPIRYWEAPRSDEIGSTVEQFLEQPGRPNLDLFSRTR